MSTLLQSLKTGWLQSRVSTGYDKYYLHKAHNNHFKAISKQLCCSYQLTRKRDCWGSQLLVAKCLRQLCRLLTCPPNIHTNLTLQLPILPFRNSYFQTKWISHASINESMNCNITKRSNLLAKRGLTKTICLWISKIWHFQMLSTFKPIGPIFSKPGGHHLRKASLQYKSSFKQCFLTVV
jgi:hypothetical protein